MIHQSKMYTFLDSTRQFSVSFFSGEKYVSDVLALQTLSPNAQDFYRQSLLGIQLLTAFLKPGEELGVYIDSEDPYFRMKIETTEQGRCRALLLPENFSDFPEKINGNCRVNKFSKQNQTPYTSILKLENDNFTGLLEKLFSQSYQLDCHFEIGGIGNNQSLLIQKLPRIDYKKEKTAENDKPLKSFVKEHDFSAFFKLSEGSEFKIISAGEAMNLTYLTSKVVEFKCNCSKDRFVDSLYSIANGKINELFGDDESLEVKCDYCKKAYTIFPEDIILARVDE